MSTELDWCVPTSNGFQVAICMDIFSCTNNSRKSFWSFLYDKLKNGTPSHPICQTFLCILRPTDTWPKIAWSFSFFSWILLQIFQRVFRRRGFHRFERPNRFHRRSPRKYTRLVLHLMFWFAANREQSNQSPLSLSMVGTRYLDCLVQNLSRSCCVSWTLDTHRECFFHHERQMNYKMKWREGKLFSDSYLMLRTQLQLCVARNDARIFIRRSILRIISSWPVSSFACDFWFNIWFIDRRYLIVFIWEFQ